MAFWWRGESLFPLGPRRPSWTISPQTPCQLPAPRFASARNGITRTPSPPYASSWPAPCSASSANARFAESDVYHTVIADWKQKKSQERDGTPIDAFKNTAARHACHAVSTLTFEAIIETRATHMRRAASINRSRSKNPENEAHPHY